MFVCWVTYEICEKVEFLKCLFLPKLTLCGFCENGLLRNGDILSAGENLSGKKMCGNT